MKEQNAIGVLRDSAGASREEQRARLQQDGYVYLPGSLDPDEAIRLVYEVEKTLEIFEHERNRNLDGFDVEAYANVQALETFHSYADSDALKREVEAITGMDLFRHPAAVLRLGYPNGSTTVTKPHQDFLVQQLSSDIFTCWIALTPASDYTQGLLVCPGSHKRGLRAPDRDVDGARPLYVAAGVRTEDLSEWATSRYAPGDAVVFSNLLVHAGGANAGPGLRLSIDTRFQPFSDPILEEHTHPHGWPEVPDWKELCMSWKGDTQPKVPPGVVVAPPLLYGVDESLASLEVPRSSFWEHLA